MTRLPPLATALALLTAAPLTAGIIHVPGDYDTIPEAVYSATADDTVRVGTGTYIVEPGSPYGWPIELDPESPTIMSEDQVGKTVLQGDGTIPAFRVTTPGFDSRVRIVGFTIRNVASPLDKLANTGAEFLFEYNNVQDCGDGLDAAWSDGLIAHNIIWNNGGYGVDIFQFTGTIEFTEIAYNTWGIRGVTGEPPTIRMNWIHRNSEGGIWAGFNIVIEHNMIIKNGGPGIAQGAVGGQIIGNTIRENAVGVTIHGSTSVLIRENGIYGNEPYDVRVETGGRFDYDMTMNWWGTTDAELIAEHIWDCADDPALEPCVLFDPFCMNPACEPTLVEPWSWGAIKSLYR